MKRSHVCVLTAILTASLGIAGCSSGDSPHREGHAPTSTPPPDPPAQLREIAERGKAKAPSSAGEGYTFIDVRVEVIKSSSLTYPYVGRIIADYKGEEIWDIDRCVVYFKYEGNKWVFAKYERGGGGGTFPGPLTEDRALTPHSNSSFNSPYPAVPKFTVWLP